jgi:hypothetical protein
MLGDVSIAEERGKTSPPRVLPNPAAGPNVIESSFQSHGTIMGQQMTNTGTVTATPMPAGLLSSEGRGIAFTNDGGMISWTFSGVARPTGPDGAMSVRGQVLFQSAPPDLSALLGTCGLVEAEIDSEQNFAARMWSWT